MKRRLLFSIFVVTIIAIIQGLVAIVVSINSVSGSTHLMPSPFLMGTLILSAIIVIVLSVWYILDLLVGKRQQNTLDKQLLQDLKDEEIRILQRSTLEMQIKQEILNVVNEVKNVRNAIEEKQAELELTRDVVAETNEVIHAANSNPRAALILLSAKIETQIRLRLQEAGLQSQTNYSLSRRALDTATKEELLSSETLSAFRDFVSVRNKIAHDAAFQIDEPTILALISIGIELLKIVSVIKQGGSEVTISDIF